MAESQQQSQQQQVSQQPHQQQQQQQQNNPVQQQAVRQMSQQSQQTGSPAIQHAAGNQPPNQPPGQQQQQQQQQHPQQQAIQPQPIQPQQQQPQNIQPQPQQQQNLHHQQQHQQQLQQQAIQPQQIQSLPQLQIAPQQQQHVLPNLHTMTSVPLSMTMTGNPMTANLTGGNIRPQLGQLQQVQVIQQAMQSPTFMPAQFAYSPQQQQLMLQNMQAAMHMSMNPQQLNMANVVAMQNRPNTGMFTPGAMSQTPSTPTSGTFVTISSAPVSQPITTTTSTVTAQGKNANSKQQSQQQQQQNQQQQQQQQQQQLHTLGQVQQAQATAMIGGKPIILGQAGSLMQGQIGVISAGQLQTTQAYATGQNFGQLQSKSGQQINLAASTGQGQIQLNGSQGGIRFSQGQLVSNGGNTQLITSQPVFSNQMFHAMSHLQHFQPQTPIMLTQGQTPTLNSGQKLYINPVQTQNLMTGVATAMNTNFKSPTQQTLQNVALPIQKQTTAAQTGKVLLPSMSKTPSTAKVPPNSASGGAAKSPAQSMSKNKGRPKGSGKLSPAISSPSSASQGKPDSSPCQSKSITPSVVGSPDLKRESDSELDASRKSINEDPLSDAQFHDNEEPMGITKHDKSSDKPVSAVDMLPDYRPSIIASEQPVERQRAIVKPHILTHVIEGFVIQEGPEPFPVQRSSLLTEFIPPKPGQPVEQSSLISMDDEEMDQEAETSHEESGPMSGPLHCEICNMVFSSLNPSQRFCSKSCAKRYNVGCTKRLQHFPGKPKDSVRAMKRKRKGKKSWGGSRHTSSGSMAGLDMEDQSSSVSQEDTSSPSTTPDLHVTTPPPNDLQRSGVSEYTAPNTSPRKWNVQEVYEFIRNLQGCSMYAEEFRSQEIDGQALLLLKEDHLMTTMNMKLGPALKICARINAIKEETD